MEWLPRDLERERYSQVHGTCPFKKEYINKKRQSAWNIKKNGIWRARKTGNVQSCVVNRKLCAPFKGIVLTPSRSAQPTAPFSKPSLSR